MQFALFDKVLSHPAILAALLPVLVPTGLHGQLSPPDSVYQSFFWTRAPGETVNRGYYGTLTPDSTGSNSGDEAVFSLFGGSWLKSLAGKASTRLDLHFSSSIPDSIGIHSGRFSTTPWLDSISVHFGKEFRSIRFFFPLLPKNQSYRTYDHFSVHFAPDTVLQFQAVSDTLFIGSFTNDRRRGSGRTRIYAKNAIAVTTTSSHAMRIRSLQIDGAHRHAASSYLRLNLDTLDSDAEFYGISIIDTSANEVIFRIRSISVENAPVLRANSSVRVSWSYSGASLVRCCSLFVASGSGEKWLFTGRAVGKETSMTWLVPPNAGDSCRLMLRAYGEDHRSSEIQSSKLSIITDDAEVRDTASEETVRIPENRFTLLGSVLDPSTLRLVWSCEGEKTGTIDSIMIASNEFHFPIGADDSTSLRTGMYPTTATCDTIRNLSPGTTYFFALFVMDTAGHWSKKGDRAILRLTTGPKDGYAVRLETDPVSILSDSVKITPQSGLLEAYIDTMHSWKGPGSNKGFIRTAPGFEFRKGNLPETVGLRLEIRYGSISPPWVATDQHIYRYNIYTGQWRVVLDSLSIDTSSHTISTIINDIRMPMIVMIDTMPPLITHHPNRDSVLTVDDNASDRFLVEDNIENPVTKLLAGPGDGGYQDFSLYATAKDGTYRTVIPLYIADECSGMRGLFVAGDGRNADTVNLSRPIMRQKNNCDDFETAEMEWSPMRVTASPVDERIATAVSVSRTENAFTDYDKKEERIIRWLQSDSGGGWAEYSQEEDSQFAFTPGRLLWIKTRKSREIHFGAAIVPSLADTFRLELNGNGWTDLANPYAFDIYLRDILNAGESHSGRLLDSLELYEWIKYDDIYHTEAIYLPGITEVKAMKEIVFEKGSLYTAYLKGKSGKTISIPPVSLDLSDDPGSNHLEKQPAGSWAIKIGILDDGKPHASLYCASTPSGSSPRYYATPPSFSSLRTGIPGRSGSALYGHAAIGDLREGGTAFEIVSVNDGDQARGVTLLLRDFRGIPGGMRTGFIPERRSCAGIVDDSAYVRVEPGKRERTVLVIGTVDYLHRFYRKFTSVISLKPRFVCGRLFLDYTLPYDTKTAAFSIFDLQGRRVGKHRFNRTSVTLDGTISLSESLANGFYFLELRTTGRSSGPHTIRKKIVYVR